MRVFDLVVVGAGILGTSHALQAARLGKRVVLLEKDNRPEGATVRNFGQVVPSGLAGRWQAYGRRSVETYKEIQQEYDISVRAQGSVYVASDGEEWQIAQEAAELFKDKSLPNELLSDAQTHKRFPYLRKSYVKGSIFFPEDLSVEPDKMVHRLIDFGIQKYGITYLADTAVLACEPKGDLIETRTAWGTILQSERTLICNGSEFRMLFPDLYAASGLIVSKLQMLQTHSLPQVELSANVLTGLTLRRYEAFEECPSFARLTVPPHYKELKELGIHILFKQATDGSVLIGDSHEYAPATRVGDLGFDVRSHINQLILDEAERIVNFPVRGIARSWAGYYAQHPDEVFEYEVAPQLNILTGVGGKGMTSSLGFAEENVRRWYGASS
jgi:D-hydroxyproline dehydrogenase subunit beta